MGQPLIRQHMALREFLDLILMFKMQMHLPGKRQNNQFLKKGAGYSEEFWQLLCFQHFY